MVIKCQLCSIGNAEESRKRFKNTEIHINLKALAAAVEVRESCESDPKPKLIWEANPIMQILSSTYLDFYTTLVGNQFGYLSYSAKKINPPCWV